MMWRFRNIFSSPLSSFSSQISYLFTSSESDSCIPADLGLVLPQPPPQQSTHYWAISHWPLALWAAWTSDRPHESLGDESEEIAQCELCEMKQKPSPIKNQLRVFAAVPPWGALEVCQISTILH